MNDFLRGLAPTVASALLGPFAGIATAGLTKLFNLDGGTIKDVAKAIADGKVTPEVLAELRKMEAEYKEHEAERGYKYAELEFKNTDSARAMQIATNSTTPTVLTYMVTIGFFGILGWMLNDPHVIDSPPLMIMLGSLGTAWTGCINFWLGSNSGSNRTKELLAQATVK